MRNIILSLSYDGTAYRGWQSQVGGNTVQDIITEAVFKITGEKVCVTGCGRTDAGVHAKVYAANFKTDSAIPESKFVNALNHYLPDDICIKAAMRGSDSFNSRYDCIKKTYTYNIFNSTVPDPFLRKYALRYPAQLNLAAMREAAAHFVGKHDFAAVHSLGTPVSTTVRTLYDCTVSECEQPDIVQISMCADGFLYNMARSIVGTLLYVSEGKLAPSDIPKILTDGIRQNAGPTAPAHGLFLSALTYPDFSL